jgi:3-oxoacyl-[acyl-carrier-protein] synthase II
MYNAAEVLAGRTEMEYSSRWHKVKENLHDTGVYVVAMGIVSPIGNDLASFQQNLMAGEHGFAKVPRNFKAYTDVAVYGKVQGFDTEKMLYPLFDRNRIKHLERSHLSAHYTTHAVFQALNELGILDEDNKIDSHFIDRRLVGMSIGTGEGGSAQRSAEVGLRLGMPHLARREQIKTEDILHALAGRIVEVPDMLFGAQGPLKSVNGECASGIYNIADGANEIISGRAELMIVGGGEAPFDPWSIAMFERTGTLSEATDPNKAGRSLNKKGEDGGMVMGEGAAIMILASGDMARRLVKEKGAKVYAKVVGFGNRSDAGHETLSNGRGFYEALDEAVQMAGIPQSADIFISPHATATMNDAPEMGIIGYRFPNHDKLGVNALKQKTGHMFGSAGTAEGIQSVLALNTQTLPPHNIYDDYLEEVQDMNTADGTKKENQQFEYAIDTSLGFGGHNGVAVFIASDIAAE